MSALPEIKPKNRQRLIDLVRAAGVNVSDWASVKGGARKAASNPKYCYEWSFAEEGKVVVLCLKTAARRPDLVATLKQLLAEWEADVDQGGRNR